MYKVYSLLRDNKQTGPYSLEEIIQMGLKPFDLIWVDGKSAGWRYPGEVESLKPYAPAIPQSFNSESSLEINDDHNYSNSVKEVPAKTTISKHIFVRMPGNTGNAVLNRPMPKKESADIENKADELLQASAAIRESKEVVVDKKYSRSLNEVEEDYTKWVFKSKSKSSTAAVNMKSIIAIFIAALIAGASYFLFLKNGEPTPPTSKSLVSDAVANQKEVSAQNVQVIQKVPAIAGDSKNTIQNKAADNTGKINKAKIIKTPANKRPKGFNPKILPQVAAATTKKPVTIEENRSTPVQQKDIKSSNKTTSSKKKNSLGNAINNLFARLKQPKVKEEAKEPAPTTTARIPAQMQGGRMSRKREDETPNTSPETANNVEKAVPSEDLVEITANNTAAENWQIGIYDLKISLHNHNNLSIRRAMVDVLYYDENNRMLEKKRLVFTNIPAKGMLTIKAPDQKWADHTEYLLTAIE